MIQFEVEGKVPSKSNSYKLATKGRTPIMYKGHDLKHYERNFIYQTPAKYKSLLIDKPFKLHVIVYFDSRRPDIDNSLKIILDCLENTKTIKNDNLCYRLIAEKKIDKENPRVLIRLEVLE